jgi:GcrA cell cycle regulator
MTTIKTHFTNGKIVARTFGPTSTQVDWTPPVVSMLRKMWRGPLSASKIAIELSEFCRTEVTKNAVIGKVHRLGLAKRKSGIKPRKQAKMPSTRTV